MTKLRERLKAQQAERLDLLVSEAREALAELVTDNGVAVTELARMVTGGRTDTLEKTLVNRLVRKAEDELVELYNSQHTLPIEEKDAA